MRKASKSEKKLQAKIAIGIFMAMVGLVCAFIYVVVEIL